METVVQAIALFCALSSLAMLVFQVSLLVLSWKTPVGTIRETFPVSILKPLKGIDDDLEENLRCIIEQNYPFFEVIFGAEDPEDPALEVARRLREEYPNNAILIQIGDTPAGYNPKVRILRAMMKKARHDWLLVSDSNVRPSPNYLSQMVATQSHSGAALVHSRLSGFQPSGAGGRLEELQLNTWVALAIQLAQRLGRPCVIGKSMLMRRSALNSVGGFRGVRDVLAEDYVLGERFRVANLGVALSMAPLPVVVGAPQIRGFFNRHVRWGQMRRKLSIFAFLLEFLSNPTPFLFTLLLLAPSFRSTALATLLLKWLIDGIFYQRNALTPSVRTLCLLPLRDLLIPIMWCISALSSTVNWRGTTLSVGAGSVLSPQPERPLSRFRTLSAAQSSTQS